MSKGIFTRVTPVPGPAQSIQTGPGNVSLLLLRTVFAEQAPLPGHLFLFCTILTIIFLFKVMFPGSLHPLPLQPSSTSPGLSPSPPVILQHLSGLPQLPMASLQALLPSYSLCQLPRPLSKPSCHPIAPLRPSSTSPGVSPSPPAFLLD